LVSLVCDAKVPGCGTGRLLVYVDDTHLA